MAFSATTTSYSSSICFPANNGIRLGYVGFFNPLVSTQFKKPRTLKIRSNLESNVSDMQINTTKGLFPPEPKLKVVELFDQGHEVDIYESRTSINKGGEVGELHFRFIFGATLHGINAFLTTNQLKPIDIARNALALALSTVVRAMRVIRNSDNAFGPGMDPFRPDQNGEDYIYSSMEGATFSGRQASSFVCYAVPKKRRSASKKRIRKNIWKKKASVTALKAVSLGKSISTGNSKSFFVRQAK